MQRIRYKSLTLDAYGIDIGKQIITPNVHITQDTINMAVFGWSYICPDCGKKIGLDITDGQTETGVICGVYGCHNKATEIGLDIGCVTVIE